jgi:hypothetical protein
MNSYDKKYQEHEVFEKLTIYISFYNSLSISVMNWVKPGIQAITNLDTYVYSSTKGTLESVFDILKKRRINDSYALLRKYFDSAVINIYSNLFLEDNISIDNFIVKQIDNWRKGTEKLPEYRIMANYIKNSSRLSEMTNLLHKDNRYKNIRQRCNDHTHYNYFRNILLNDNEIYLQNERLLALNSFSEDLDDIFIYHFSYIFYLHNHYMMSSDYFDNMDIGFTQEDGSEYFVAPFVQEIFNSIIKPKRKDIADEIKTKTTMRLE